MTMDPPKLGYSRSGRIPMNFQFNGLGNSPWLRIRIFRRSNNTGVSLCRVSRQSHFKFTVHINSEHLCGSGLESISRSSDPSLAEPSAKAQNFGPVCEIGPFE